jgi:hypothetical protein
MIDSPARRRFLEGQTCSKIDPLIFSKLRWTRPSMLFFRLLQSDETLFGDELDKRRRNVHSLVVSCFTVALESVTKLHLKRFVVISKYVALKFLIKTLKTCEACACCITTNYLEGRVCFCQES